MNAAAIAVEQPRLRENVRAGAYRAKNQSFLICGAQPFDGGGMTVLLDAPAATDDDRIDVVEYVAVGNPAVRIDAQTVTCAYGVARLGNSFPGIKIVAADPVCHA